MIDQVLIFPLVQVFFFSLVKVIIPEYNEQVAIADILTKANEQIKMSEQQIFILQQQKKALMQKLLTGEIRVNI